MIVGTLLYASPEQAGGQVDARSDIYSLGCVLYEMLVGSPPFNGPPETLIARHALDPPPSIRSVRVAVPDVVERIVLRALEKAPADRFATAAQFAEALRAPPGLPSGGEGDSDGESIAVLPFANLSGDPEAEYFSDGITEEIINALARIPGLRVAARTSCFAFRGKAADLADIGAKLKVKTVLEGSVRRSGQRLRITAQLVKVRDGYHFWSERYDRELEDVFAIQEEIARMIADRLQVTFGDGQRVPVISPPTKSLDAYHLYLKGRYYWQQRGLGLKQALECFSRALALDPDYALAHAGLADACSLIAQYGFAPPGRMLPQAHAAARRALELAPELAEAYCASGTLALLFDWDWARAATDLRRAIELNPRYDAARYWLAFYLTYIEGRFEEGVAHAERAVALDPLAALPAAQLGLVLIGAGRHDAAIATLRRSIALDAGLFLPYLMLGVLYEHLERSEEAYATLETAVAVSGRHPWTLAHLAVSASSLGRLEEAQAIHDELYARTRREYVQSAMLALVTAAVGRVDEGFALLERACEERDGILFYSLRYPAFKVLKRDPRMNGIYRRIGFPE
jgi:serine/threonine-protein kinase